MIDPAVATQIADVRNDTRTQLHAVTREVSVERVITRDLVEALHKRLDGIEAMQAEILREVKSLKAETTGNGHG